MPAEDLVGIDRIYIIRSGDIKAAVNYTPVLYKINLVWENAHPEGSVKFRGPAFYTEKVLYHEIGHYVHRHTWGQIPKQEKETEIYAMKIILDKSPKVSWLLKKVNKTRGKVTDYLGKF